MEVNQLLLLKIRQALLLNWNDFQQHNSKTQNLSFTDAISIRYLDSLDQTDPLSSAMAPYDPKLPVILNATIPCQNSSSSSFPSYLVAPIPNNRALSLKLHHTPMLRLLNVQQTQRNCRCPPEREKIHSNAWLFCNPFLFHLYFNWL